MKSRLTSLLLLLPACSTVDSRIKEHESLFAALPAETLQRMWALIVGLLRRGVEERRIVTTRGLEITLPLRSDSSAAMQYL